MAGVLLAPSLASVGPSDIVYAPVAPTTQQVPQEVPMTLETQVIRLAKEYKQDPILALKIIKCEGMRYGSLGNNKNLDANGKVWSTDIGPWQINDYFHERRALEMGLNIHKDEDNLRYGFILMSEQGTRPWTASSYCWNK